MKITCLLSFLFILGAADFPHHTFAMMEDEENTDLLQSLHTPPLERILYYLPPGAILDLSSTSKNWRQRTAILWPQALIEVRQFKINARDPRALSSERIRALASLSLGDPWRNQCLISWADDPGADTMARINSARALPQNERNRRLHAWATSTKFSIKYSVLAAISLPSENPERNELLRAWSKNASMLAHNRIRAADALPVEDPFRQDFLRAWAQDTGWLLHNRLLAAKAMMAGTERDTLLQKLNTPESLRNPGFSPAANHFRKK